MEQGLRSKFSNGLRRGLEGTVLTLMTTLALVVVVGVVFRKAGASLVWYDEVASILLAWLTYYGGALAALHRSHIGMPTLVEKLSGGVRTAVILVGEVCTIGFFSVLAWAGIRVLTVLGGTTLVSLPAVPMSVAQSVIPIGAVLFIAAQLLSLPDVLAGVVVIDDDLPPISETAPSVADDADRSDAAGAAGTPGDSR